MRAGREHAEQNGSDDAGASDASSVAAAPHESRWQRVAAFVETNSLLVMMFGAISLAYIYPPLGTKLVNPDITSSWIAVIVIFFVSGIGLRTEELSRALSRPRFNLFVQAFNFFVVSGLVFAVSRSLVDVEKLSKALADGIVICSCLPQATCKTVVLTKAASGDDAVTILNTAFSNVVGVVLSPLLIVCYLGVKPHVDKGEVVFKLLMKVTVPLCAGQIVHHCVPGARDLQLKKVQELAMSFILFTTFSQLFMDGLGTDIVDVALMIVTQLVLIASLGIWCWLSLRLCFPGERKLHASGLFICMSKTMPMGIPLIHAMYSGDEHLVLYTLPLLAWSILTTVIGIFIARGMSEYVGGKEREFQAVSIAEMCHGDYYEMGERDEDNDTFVIV